MRTSRARVRTALVPLALIAGCAGSSGTADAPGSPTRLVVPSSPSTRPSVSPRGSLPPEAAAVQGARFYAVFLAVAPTATDDRLARARVRATALGYEGGEGEIGCTAGAREQLGLSPTADYFAYSIFFATKAQADRVAAVYGSGVVGIAHITGGCLD